MPSRREALEQRLEETRRELLQYLAEEEGPILQAFLGRYFKCRKSPADAPRPEHSWWCYLTPTTLVNGNTLVGMSFQHDMRGEITCRLEDHLHFLVLNGQLSPGYLEITPEEFWGAWAALQVQIQQAAERAGRPLGL